jgi:predicted  nucleic acid-binding Zn-ribbon protein
VPSISNLWVTVFEGVPGPPCLLEWQAKELKKEIAEVRRQLVDSEEQVKEISSRSAGQKDRIQSLKKSLKEQRKAREKEAEQIQTNYSAKRLDTLLIVALNAKVEVWAPLTS